jgi:hypothetical protein
MVNWSSVHFPCQVLSRPEASQILRGSADAPGRAHVNTADVDEARDPVCLQGQRKKDQTSNSNFMKESNVLQITASASEPARRANL